MQIKHGKKVFIKCTKNDDQSDQPNPDHVGAQRHIRVNAVAPTYIETPLLKNLENQDNLVNQWLDMTPAKRMGQAHEIASIVQFLASDASSLITGSIITADAGYTCI